jgi:hypothetical protein
MRIQEILWIPLVVGALSAFAEPRAWKCPDETSRRIQPQGNTATWSCLDAQGIPHGPFLVKTLPDSSNPGSEQILVEGAFDHGERIGDWQTFSEKGTRLETRRFKEDPDAGLKDPMTIPETDSVSSGKAGGIK